MKSIEKYGGVEIFEREQEIPLYVIHKNKLSQVEIELKEKLKEFAITNIVIDPKKIRSLEKRKEIFTTEVKDIYEKNFKRSYELYNPDRKNENVIIESVVEDMVGYGAIDPLIYDEKLEEIMLVGLDLPVFVYHKTHGTCETNVSFNFQEELLNIAQKIARDVNRRIDINQPILDATLHDGSRVNVTIPPISLDGVSITIRKFRRDPLSFVQLLNNGTISSELAAFLWIAVDGLGVRPCNMIIAGGTACGKTSLLDALLLFVPKHERIISLEDTVELHLKHKNRIRLETRPPNVEGTGEIDMDDLLKNALRMRPDRLIVGEVRGSEAQTLFTAMNTGHDGCMGTIHANSSNDVITRLINPPLQVPPSMVPALDLVVMEEKIFSKKRGVIRRVVEVAELTTGESGEMQINKIFKWNPTVDKIKGTGIPSRTQFRFEEFASMLGTDFKEELKRREDFIKQLEAEGLTDFEKIHSRINEYRIEHGF